MSEVFDVLSKFGIVHSDIKPDNILIKMNDNLTDIK
jgi:serine/threonine protein kinase